MRRPFPLRRLLLASAGLLPLMACRTVGTPEATAPLASEPGGAGAVAAAPPPEAGPGTGPATAPEATPAAAARPPILAPTSAPRTPLPRDAAEVLARLAREAASGADPALAGHADLLAAATAACDATTETTSLRRLADLEAAERARLGRGMPWSNVTTYREVGGEARAMRRAYLDFDRLHEWTGKPGTRRVGVEGEAVLGVADGMRSALGIRYGARWHFRAVPLQRDGALLIASSQVEAPDTTNMLATRSLLVLVPVAGGVEAVEVTSSVLDVELPALLRSVASEAALRELRARTEGLRAHWREYVEPAPELTPR